MLRATQWIATGHLAGRDQRWVTAATDGIRMHRSARQVDRSRFRGLEASLAARRSDRGDSVGLPRVDQQASAGQPAQDAQKLVQKAYQAHHIVDRFEDGADQRAQNVGASGNARHVDGDRLCRDLQSENVQVDRAQVQVQHLTIRRLLHADWSVAAERRARRKLNGKFERSGEHGGENDQASPAGSVRPRTAYLMPWIPSGKTGSIAEPPPSTCRVWPVMKQACSVHIRTTALPMSA